MEVLGVAATYFGTGRVALLLAVPPGYATALWPPSGIALSALLLLGTRAWPGVFLGSLLVNLSTSFDRFSPGRSFAIAASIGVGASLQALAGAVLVRRFVGPSLALQRVSDIVKFLLLGGPVSCVLGATLGVAALHREGVLKAGELPFSGWTWWVGDVIGVLIVAPLVLIAFGEPRGVWRRRAAPVAVPLAILLALATGLFVAVSAVERSRISSRFGDQANVLVRGIETRLADTAGALRRLEQQRSEPPRMDRARFSCLAADPLSKLPFLLAVSWNPRVADADRAAFERGGPDGADGPCPITERDAKEHPVPAARRSEYVPIRYIEPYEANARAVGFDVSSGIVRLQALKQACDSGTAAVTRRIRLMQERDEAFGLIVFVPAYADRGASTTPEERRRQVIGYVAGVIRLDDFFSFLKADWVDAEIADGEGGEVIWRSSPSAAATEIQHSSRISFGGRSWTVTCRATPAHLASERSWRPWGVLAAGLAFAGLAGAVLLAVTGRALGG